MEESIIQLCHNDYRKSKNRRTRRGSRFGSRQSKALSVFYFFEIVINNLERDF